MYRALPSIEYWWSGELEFDLFSLGSEVEVGPLRMERYYQKIIFQLGLKENFLVKKSAYNKGVRCFERRGVSYNLGILSRDGNGTLVH